MRGRTRGLASFILLNVIMVVGMNEENIIDRFVLGGLPAGFHEEQERAVLREHGFPAPFILYLSLAVIMLYAALYYYCASAKPMAGNVIIKVLPLALITIGSAYVLVAYKDNYVWIVQSLEYYYLYYL